MPRFLTDENIPRSIAEWLRDKGYDTTRASEVNLRGASDSTLIKWSQREDRIILSLDEDFIRLHRQLKKPFGVIVIRTHPPTPDKIKYLLTRLFSKVEIEKHSKELLMVTDREIRIESH